MDKPFYCDQIDIGGLERLCGGQGDYGNGGPLFFRRTQNSHGQAFLL
jgi:hypothetical protein